MLTMLELCKLTNNWTKEIGITINHCPPEARVITGVHLTDARLHYLQQESGIELKVSDTYAGYDVVDEQKFAWFLLRWS